MEREAKFEVWPGFAVPDLDGVVPGATAVALAPQELEATYYDTGDLRLARSGITVRYRTGEGDEGIWTVKLPDEANGGPAMHRREVVVRAPGEVVPDDVANLVRAFTRRAALEPVATLATKRARIEVRDADGAPLAEVDDDEVAVARAAGISSRFREVEVELATDAPPELLDSIGELLRGAGARPADATPKLMRALGPDATAPADVAVIALRKKSSVREVVSAAIAAGAVRLMEHDPGVRLGDDPEDVHQARVATRRLRSDLRTLRNVLDRDAATPLSAELGWLAGALGDVRDADVLLERMRDETAALPGGNHDGAQLLLDRIAADRETHRVALLAAMTSDRYIGLLDQLIDRAVDPPCVPAAADERAAPALRDSVGLAWRHLKKAVEALGEDPADAALHDVRIRAKRCRYAAELAAPVLGKAATRLAKGAAGVQTVLGDFHDAVVAEERLRAMAADGPPLLAFVAGQLVARERATAAHLRTAWWDAWKAIDRKDVRALLH